MVTFGALLLIRKWVVELNPAYVLVVIKKVSKSPSPSISSMAGMSE